MGGHEQSVLHKTIKIHLECSIFKSQTAAFFLLPQREHSQSSSDCTGRGHGGWDREQTEPQGKRSSRGKVCIFHPISTMLPPVDTSATETRNLTKPSLVPCASLLSRGRPVHGKRGSLSLPGIALRWTRAGADSTEAQILAQ